MKEQLSEEKIDKLFTFVKSKYVQYNDVQFEIVDHLATAIEEKQVGDPSLSFDTALNQVYSKFPITGFAMLIDAKQSALNKFWLKKFFGFMLSYMKLPKIIIAAFLVFIIKTILSTGILIHPRQLYYILIILAVSSVAYRYKYGFEFKKEFRDKYLVTSTYLALYSGIWMVYLFLPLSVITEPKGSLFSVGTSWVLSIYLTTVLLWIHAYTFEFPKMLKQELEDKYGHLNIKLA